VPVEGFDPLLEGVFINLVLLAGLLLHVLLEITQHLFLLSANLSEHDVSYVVHGEGT
jgi:hypothetical protein